MLGARLQDLFKAHQKIHLENSSTVVLDIGLFSVIISHKKQKRSHADNTRHRK